MTKYYDQQSHVDIPHLKVEFTKSDNTAAVIPHELVFAAYHKPRVYNTAGLKLLYYVEPFYCLIVSKATLKVLIRWTLALQNEIVLIRC